MLAAQHLISRSDTAQEKAEQQSVSFSPRCLKNIIQRHQGKSSCRMPGRKTTRRMNGMKPGGIPFKQVDIRRNTAVYGQLVRTIYPGCVFQKSNCRRNYNGSQHQSQRPLPIRFQKRISVRSRRYDCRNASHCGNKNFHSAIEKRGQPQMAFVEISQERSSALKKALLIKTSQSVNCSAAKVSSIPPRPRKQANVS